MTRPCDTADRSRPVREPNSIACCLYFLELSTGHRAILYIRNKTTAVFFTTATAVVTRDFSCIKAHTTHNPRKHNTPRDPIDGGG